MCPKLDINGGETRIFTTSIQKWLKDLLENNDIMRHKMFDLLIEKINWISPELISMVGDFHRIAEASVFELEDKMMFQRRIEAACDLCYHLVRLLELSCSSRAFIRLLNAPSQPMIANRLAELLAWGLQTFAAESHLNTMVQQICSMQESRSERIENSWKRSITTDICVAYVGVLVALQQSMSDILASEDSDSIASAHWNRFLQSLYDLSVTPSLLSRCFKASVYNEYSDLDLPTDSEELAFQKLIESLEKIRASSQMATSSGHNKDTSGLAAEADIPEEFLDPILNTIMKDPVILPDSKMTIDRETIQRHLSISPTDPFSRQALREEDLLPNTELLEKIKAWSKPNNN